MVNSYFELCSSTRRLSKVVDGVVVVLLFSPESEVLLEELNDGLGITEVVFLELVNFVEGILEGLVSEVTGGLVVLHGLVMEDGEVKGETELDGVARGEGDAVGLVVGGKGLLLNLLEVVTLGVLGDVTVVVSDHLDEESLGLSVAGLGEDLVVDHVDDSLAVTLELGLNAGLVSKKGISELGVLGVLLGGGNGSAGSSLGRDQVLESDGQEVTLVRSDIGSLLGKDVLELVDHIFESLGLFSDTRQKDVFLNVGHILKIFKFPMSSAFIPLP